QLARLEGATEEDVSGAVERGLGLAAAYLDLGRPVDARGWLASAVGASFGVGYSKDYQLGKWIGWLGRVVPLEPARATERVAWFAGAVAALHGRTEKAHRFAAEDLLGVAVRWSPPTAVRLLGWLSERRVLRNEGAGQTVLCEALAAPCPPLDLVLGLTK